MTLTVTMKDGRRITACTTVQYVVVTIIDTLKRGIAVEIQHKNGKIELIASGRVGCGIRSNERSCFPP